MKNRRFSQCCKQTTSSITAGYVACESRIYSLGICHAITSDTASLIIHGMWRAGNPLVSGHPLPHSIPPSHI